MGPCPLSTLSSLKIGSECMKRSMCLGKYPTHNLFLVLNKNDQWYLKNMHWKVAYENIFSRDSSDAGCSVSLIFYSSMLCLILHCFNFLIIMLCDVNITRQVFYPLCLVDSHKILRVCTYLLNEWVMIRNGLTKCNMEKNIKALIWKARIW